MILFEGFHQLGDLIHVYRPASTQAATPEAPKLVVLCSWAFARPKHITKYLAGYQKLYPAATVLVIQNDMNNMIWRPTSWQIPLLEPAIVTLMAEVPSSHISPPGILLHVFSNGGTHTATMLAQAYHARTGLNLPVSAMILDSCPGQPRYLLGARALTQGLPNNIVARTIGVPLVHLTLAATVFLQTTGLVELPLITIWRTLNDRSGPFLRPNVARTYFYSTTDDVMTPVDILQHAQEARTALGADGDVGNSLIRTEEFVGSGHVNHLSTDPERYWRMVQKTWQRSWPVAN